MQNQPVQTLRPPVSLAMLKSLVCSSSTDNMLAIGHANFVMTTSLLDSKETPAHRPITDKQPDPLVPCLLPLPLLERLIRKSHLIMTILALCYHMAIRDTNQLYLCMTSGSMPCCYTQSYRTCYMASFAARPHVSAATFHRNHMNLSSIIAGYHPKKYMGLSAAAKMTLQLSQLSC